MNPDRIDRLADQVICDCCRDGIIGELARRIVHEVKHAKRTGNRIRPIPFGLWYRQQEPFVRRWKKTLKKHWEWEQGQVLANLRKLGKMAGYRVKADLDVDVALFPKAQAKKRLQEAGLRELAAILVYFGEEEIARLNLGTGFNLDNPHVRRWINQYTVRLANEVETETLDRLMAALREGIGNNETIPDLTRRVRDVFGDMEKWRAEMIARTETIRAANKGALEAYRQSGVVRKKVWLAAPDACDWCLDLNGHVIDLEENFYNLGDTVTANVDGKESSMNINYEDIGEPPLHPRCRCAVSGWIED